MAQTQLAILLTSVALVVIGLYSAIFVDNIIKKIIGISFIEEGANLFIVAIGYSYWFLLWCSTLLCPLFHFWTKLFLFCFLTPYTPTMKCKFKPEYIEKLSFSLHP